MASPDSIAMARAIALALGADAGTHPHLRMGDLSPWLQDLVGRHVWAYLAESKRRGRVGERAESMAYLAALENFGIDCPHVPLEGSRFARYPDVVLECRHCGTVVVRAPNGRA